jgi:predicted acylesterase/phospholipase RssA
MSRSAGRNEWTKEECTSNDTLNLKRDVQHRLPCVNLLCFEGGGARGLISIVIYQELCKQLGDENLIRQFNLCGGTSSGAIISAMLSLLCIPPNTCYEIYAKLLTDLFGSFSILGSLSNKWYDPRIFEKFLDQQFRTKELKEYKAGVNGCLNWVCVSTEISHNVMKPFVFRNYDSCLKKIIDNEGRANTLDHSRSYLHEGYMISDALMASFAIPHFFGEHQLGEKTYTDGGILSNSPIKQILMEAKSLWPQRDLCVVSIGCGTPDRDSTTITTPILTDWKHLSQVTELQYEENMDTLRMMDNLQTFRFNPPELGSISISEEDPAVWKMCVDETVKYMNSHEVMRKIGHLKSVLVDLK